MDQLATVVQLGHCFPAHTLRTTDQDKVPSGPTASEPIGAMK